MRKNVVKYDDVMNRHRKATYIQRREILTQTNIQKRIKAFIEAEVTAIANSPELLTDKLEQVVTEVFPFADKTLDKLFDTESSKFEKTLAKEANKLYETLEADFGDELMRKVERDIYLQVLDNLWMQHLENMDHLRQGIHWISVGQRDPLVEYRKQSQAMFEVMQEQLRHDVVRALYSAEPVDSEEPIETELTRAARNSVDNASQIVDATEFQETDFVSAPEARAEASKTKSKIKKSRKVERQRRKKGRRK